MTWWSGKVAAASTSSRGGARGGSLAAYGAAAVRAGERSADAVAAELEQQARQLGDRPADAASILARWIEQSDAVDASYAVDGEDACLAGGSPAEGERVVLGFREALLRSRAFESLLDVCARAPSLCAALRAESEGAAPTQLGLALRATAERLLLPGAASLWSSLLEALLDGGVGQSPGTSRRGPKGVLRWEQWARRVLAAMKQAWQIEALPRLLRDVDRRLSELVSARGSGEEGEDGGSCAMSRLGAGGGYSRQGIRQALARDALKKSTSEAADLQARCELLCCACVRLVAAESGAGSRAPKLERLLEDADDALASLDRGVMTLHAEQEELSTSLGELGGALQNQITGVHLTQQAFASKRITLEEERRDLKNRLEDIDTSLDQLEKESATCIGQERQLREQMAGTSAHFEAKISHVYRETQALADEKLRAVTYKECAHMALDVARCDATRRGFELTTQLRKRRAELRKTLAAYVQAERLRLDSIGRCLELDAAPPEGDGDGSAAIGEAVRVSQEASQSVQQLLRRATALLADTSPAASPSPPVALLALATAPAALLRGRLAGAEEDAQDLFAAREGVDAECVECGTLDADWASVSHAIYICTDCAGIHRGLGVHLSFVRSTTMDRWSARQLRRMRLGGNSRFHEFLAGYPKLCGGAATPALLARRYGSRAAAWYRRHLDAIESCDAASAEAPPPVDVGHAAEEVAMPPARGGSGEEGEAEEGGLDGSGSLLDEQTLFEAAHADLRRRLEARSVSAAAASAAASASAAAGGSAGARLAAEAID